ncbi:hypothetical protein GCM10009584_17940 [Ornithinimicrobium humiphilum]|uniref:GIY-YIG domain-containing protein n=2 Tax=Ornithinimicrobium humiphilum TaxID=125288 RepID=A0A543KLD1_9MICO|nr:hypothetical protein FB476_0736 [Ornithinimicrobium humiphilum]
MTSFRFHNFDFTQSSVMGADAAEPMMSNWPVVYLIHSPSDIYVGETGGATGRLFQHLQSDAKRHLEEVRLVLDKSFNKSVCLDLESYLIRLLSGDGRYAVLNRNEGITNREYYQRGDYQKKFDEIFEELRALGYFTRSIPEIENTDLFKLSPYKALNTEQAVAVNEVMEGLVEDLETDRRSVSVIQGGPGTGKTVVGIYLIKLLRDLATFDPSDEVHGDSVFSDYFLQGSRDLFENLHVGLVVPQQSLRKSIQKVFLRIPALRDVRVLSAFDVAESPEDFDVVVVDEAHRLTQRAAQAHGTLTKRYVDIVRSMRGEDDLTVTQLDWIRHRARHVVLLLDSGQSVRPADLDASTLDAVCAEARAHSRLYPLTTQMRVAGGSAYVECIAAVMSGKTPSPAPDDFAYDLRMFDDLAEMHQAIRARDADVGLSRLVAGYAWKWVSAKDKQAADIEIDGVRLRWNGTATDWINSRRALEEVGSIHTVQGYDLNYAGVIIGKDLQYDPGAGRLVISRNDYFDSKGKANNPMVGKVTTDADLERYITNIYRVLLTRGMRGTYIYVVDPVLRDYLRTALNTYLNRH